jgi:hypothetical protein
VVKYCMKSSIRTRNVEMSSHFLDIDLAAKPAILLLKCQCKLTTGLNASSENAFSYRVPDTKTDLRTEFEFDVFCHAL